MHSKHHHQFRFPEWPSGGRVSLPGLAFGQHECYPLWCHHFPAPYGVLVLFPCSAQRSALGAASSASMPTFKLLVTSRLMCETIVQKTKCSTELGLQCQDPSRARIPTCITRRQGIPCIILCRSDKVQLECKLFFQSVLCPWLNS